MSIIFWEEQIIKAAQLKSCAAFIQFKFIAAAKLTRKQQKSEGTNLSVKIAVNDLSFTAYRGEIFGLLGPNGAGKTTTLRMLATLIKPDSGNAFIDGKSIVTEDENIIILNNLFPVNRFGTNCSKM